MVIEAQIRITLHAVSAFAVLLYRIRRLWFVLGAVAIAWFVLALALGQPDSARLLLPLGLLLWSAVGLCAAYWLAWVPAAVRSQDQFARRSYKYLIYMVYMVLLAATLGLFLFALGLTVKGVGLAFD